MCCQEVVALHSPGSLKASALDRLLLVLWLQLPCLRSSKLNSMAFPLCVSACPSLQQAHTHAAREWLHFFEPFVFWGYSSPQSCSSPSRARLHNIDSRLKDVEIGHLVIRAKKPWFCF